MATCSPVGAPHLSFYKLAESRESSPVWSERQVPLPQEERRHDTLSLISLRNYTPNVSSSRDPGTVELSSDPPA